MARTASTGVPLTGRMIGVGLLDLTLPGGREGPGRQECRTLQRRRPNPLELVVEIIGDEGRAMRDHGHAHLRACDAPRDRSAVAGVLAAQREAPALAALRVTVGAAPLEIEVRLQRVEHLLQLRPMDLGALPLCL